MIVFNTDLLQNTFLLDSARRLRDAKFISDDQYALAKQRFPRLKTSNNLFFRIAFFALGIFCYSSVSGVFSLVFFGAFEDVYQIILFILAAVGFVCAEVLTRNNFYAHGTDDAAILGSQGFLAFATSAVFSDSLPGMCVLVISGIFCTLRYLSTISAVIAILSCAGILSYAVVELHLIPELYLTILLFAFGVGLFQFARRALNGKHAHFYYYPLRAAEFFALLIAYFSVNYLVVRELAQDLMGITVTPGNDIPLAPLFYALTFAVPVFYIVFAIREKNRLMLWTGLFTIGFSIFTIRYYYQLLPAELALLLGGIVLAAFCLMAIRKLKAKETGLTFATDRLHDSEAMSIAQAAIVNSHAVQHAPSHGNMPFGGGGFSGGGAGETY